jgi:hypothetical protein
VLVKPNFCHVEHLADLESWLPRRRLTINIFYLPSSPERRLAVAAYPGLAYVPTIDKIVAWPIWGGNTVYVLILVL